MSLPDVIPGGLIDKNSDKVEIQGDILHGDVKSQGEINENNWMDSLMSDNRMKSPQDADHIEGPRMSLKESVCSLKDVLIEAGSIPENTRQQVNVLNKKDDDSESEFEDDYAEQDIVQKSSSDSDSEFEIPERQTQDTENKPASIQNTSQKDKSNAGAKGDTTVLSDRYQPTPSIQQQAPALSTASQDSVILDVTSLTSHADAATKPNISISQGSCEQLTSTVPVPKPLFGEPTMSTNRVVSPQLQQSTEAVQGLMAHQRQGALKTSDDWDNVTTIQAEFANEKGRSKDSQTVRAVSPPLLTVQEVIDHFKQSDLSSVKPNVRTSVNRHGLSALAHFFFGPPKMHHDLQSERDLVFCVAGSPLDNDQSVHVQLLQSIYRILTGSKFDCQRFGSHWEEIGFQGRDPGTDIRGVGMLGLVQLLYFLRNPKSAQLARDVYKLSLHPTQNFPFCVMGINISRICLQSLREDLMNKECNKRHQVIEVVNEFYVGTYLHLYNIWKQGKTISDSGHVIKEVEVFAKKNTKCVLKNLEDYLKRKPATDMSVEEGQEEFFSVCKSDPDQ